MAADLHIHIYQGLSETTLAAFFRDTIGSKYFDPAPCSDDKYGPDGPYSQIASTPQVWVGEVSWLKAALFEDEATFIPDPIGKIQEIIGEDLPVIDGRLIGQIRDALALPNQTTYSIASAPDVLFFLEQYRGERCFTVSW